MDLAKQEKRYDQLARAYVYLGIAQNKQELVEKGLQILELTDEKRLVDNLKNLSNSTKLTEFRSVFM